MRDQRTKGSSVNGWLTLMTGVVLIPKIVLLLLLQGWVERVVHVRMMSVKTRTAVAGVSSGGVLRGVLKDTGLLALLLLLLLFMARVTRWVAVRRWLRLVRAARPRQGVFAFFALEPLLTAQVASVLEHIAWVRVQCPERSWNVERWKRSDETNVLVTS